MITPREYITHPIAPPAVTWIHGLRLVQHILKGDTQQTYYKKGYACSSHYKALLKELATPPRPEGLKAIFERTLMRKRRVHEVRSDMGCEIDLGAYLAGDAEPCIDYWKDITHRSSLTIVLDMNVPACDRGRSYMEDRHKLVYRLCASAFNENQAIRIIGAFGVSYSENEEKFRAARQAAGKTGWAASPGELFLIMVKDYSDPIFENVWGALRTNTTTNDLINCIMDYLVGTKDAGNGYPQHFEIDQFVRDQIVLVDPKYFTLRHASNGKVIKTRF